MSQTTLITKKTPPPKSAPRLEDSYRRDNTVVFIPARIGSKGVREKNLRELGGKPLVVWSVLAGTASEVGRVLVSTDSKRIEGVCQDAGAEVLYVSKNEAKRRGIHQDDSSMYQVLKSEVLRLDPVPDTVVLLQPTVPFRRVDEIHNCLQVLDKGLDSVFTVEGVPEKYNPAQVIVEEGNVFRMGTGVLVKDRITRRQDFPKAYIPTGSVYVFKTSNLKKKKGSIYGNKVEVVRTDKRLNINTEKDWKLAEYILKKIKN